MATDTYSGGDTQNVPIPVTGLLAWAPQDTAELETVLATGGSKDFTFPDAWRKVGLLTVDGGFEWGMEADDESIEFYQPITMATGKSTTTLTFICAETSPVVDELTRGRVRDADGGMVVDSGNPGGGKSIAVLTEEVLLSGKIRRRVAVGRVKQVTEAKSERGVVNGITVVLDVFTTRELALSGEVGQFKEWIIDPETVEAGA